jgi:hypothetical protein
MSDQREDEPTVPGPSDHLTSISGEAKWIRSLAPIGLILLAIAIPITIFSPSALWFLTYPLVIVGGVWALATAAAFLMRHF